ncbi:MAG: hypothetical protein ABI718_05705 [Acidobacteriota bacterium]
MMRPILLCLTAVFLTTPLVAGEASGKFTAGGHKPIEPKFASAYIVRDQFDARNQIVEVILSDVPIDTAQAVDALNPHANVINQDATHGHNYILLWIRKDGGVSMNATYSQSMTQYLDKTGSGLLAELTARTPSAVSGHVFTRAPVKTMSGETYSVDVTFSSDVASLPSGQKLGKGGGEPGKALKALVTAVSKRNWAGIAGGVTEATLASFNEDYRTPEENLDDAAMSFTIWLPRKQLVITGGELRGTDQATLEVEGAAFGDQKGLYLVRMFKVGSKWLFDRGALAGMIGEN